MREYNLYIDSYRELLKTENYKSAILANTAAFLNEMLTNINWVGFYLFEDNKLILSYFQGKVACSEIELDKGVCGHAFSTNKTTIVPDVDKFPGHIVCDSVSRSEIVIPININNKPFGVLDIDSPLLNRFSDNEKMFLESIITVLEEKLNSLEQNK